MSEKKDPTSWISDALEVSRRLSREAAAGRTDYVPPQEKAKILFAVKAISPSVGGDIVNYVELYTQPPCPSCSLPSGQRTPRNLRLWTKDVTARGANACLAQTERRPTGPSFTVFSAEFLSMLTPDERARFEWRTVEHYRGHNRKTLHELIGSATHVPLTALRGGNPDRFECATCATRGPAEYPLVGCLPAWLHPFDDAVRRGQPSRYLSAGDLPVPVPSCFTIGDWRFGVRLVFLPQRWAQINLRVNVEEVGVVDAELTERAA